MTLRQILDLLSERWGRPVHSAEFPSIRSMLEAARG